MSARRVVVDANVAWRALCRGREDLVEMLRPAGPLAGATLHAPRFLFVELFKHKERILRAARLPEAELLEAMHALVARVEFHDEALAPLGTWLEAFRLCAPTDEKDTPYVALALHLDAELWTEDEELKTGLRARGFDRFFEP